MNAGSNSDDGWARALHIAQRPTAPSLWQEQLADALEVCLRPDAVGVFLCALGNMLDATSAVTPREHGDLGTRLIGEFLPGLHRMGLITPSDLFDGTAEAEQRAMLRPLRTELLEPAGFQGLTGKFMRNDDGMVAGWITVFTRRSTETRRPEIEAPLIDVCRAAERSIRTSIALAVRMGARMPTLSPILLSEREREIARLAASGWSDTNISERLSIREGTVGRHLHNIFRKLGVGSRLELIVLLGAED